MHSIRTRRLAALLAGATALGVGLAGPARASGPTGVRDVSAPASAPAGVARTVPRAPAATGEHPRQTTRLARGYTTRDPALVGLYGDPAASGLAYVAVFDQSWTILGLAAGGVAPAPSAVGWLLRQQCANGAFEALRDPTARGCPTPSSTANGGFGAGPDTNSTAFAALALLASGQRAAAVRAAAWLTAHRSPSGGWAFFPDRVQAADPDSTGDVLLALAALGQAPDAHALAFLSSLRSGCTAAPPGARGGLAYAAGDAADPTSTAQAIAGAAAVALPVRAAGAFHTAALPALPPCPEPAPLPAGVLAGTGLTWLGAHPPSGSPTTGPTWTDTDDAFAVLTAARLGVGALAVDGWLAPLTRHALAAGTAQPGLAGLAASAAVAAGRHGPLPALLAAMTASLVTAAPATAPSHPARSTHPSSAAASPAAASPGAAPAPVLPHTGGPGVGVAAVGAGLVLVGGALVAGTARRRRW